jgi:hypothetical protein
MTEGLYRSRAKLSARLDEPVRAWLTRRYGIKRSSSIKPEIAESQGREAIGKHDGSNF